MRTDIRDAVPEDMVALVAVYRRSSLSNAGDRANLLAHPEVLELSEAAVFAGRTRVAVSDRRIVGFVTAVDGDTAVELDALFVDPDCMRHGIGLALVLDIVAIAHLHGRRRVEVTANEHARAFYVHAGFVDDGITEIRFGPAPRMHLDVAPRVGGNDS
jgi:GNAT superfamily N-acetyltransferase